MIWILPLTIWGTIFDWLVCEIGIIFKIFIFYNYFYMIAWKYTFFHNIYTKLTIHVSSNSNKNKRKKEEAILMITQRPIFLTIRHNKIITHGKLKTQLFHVLSNSNKNKKKKERLF